MIPENFKEEIDRYLHEGIPPCGFVKAVLSNDLVLAFTKADHHNEQILKEYVKYMVWEIPSGAWGSREVVDEVIENGGSF